MASYRHCGHFGNSLPRDRADATIRKFVALLEKWRDEESHVSLSGVLRAEDAFDTFAFSGMSGALIAPTLAHLMGKELLLIRKHRGEDGSASKQWVEGNVGAKRVVVVDDLIATGKTMSNLLLGLKFNVPEAAVVGLLLYDHIGATDLFLPGSSEFRLMSKATEGA